MSAVFERIKQGFEGLSAREQWLIALSGWMVIVGLAFLLFLEPISKTLSVAKAEFSQQQRITQELLALNQLKQEKLSTAPDADIKHQLAAINEEIAALDAEVERKVDGLVSASQMALLMESVLKQSDRLTLLSMTSLPARQLTENGQAGFFIHPIELTLKGRFFDIVDYLSVLEALPVKYYWKSVGYRVMDYPWAEVTLHVYTLGESTVFIGGTHEGNE